MDPRAALRAAIEVGPAFDDIEGDHRADVLAWIDSGVPLYRQVKPATPPKHLVSYALLVDPDQFEVLLIDHRLSGLWLPTGGHVEPGEDPFAAAARELTEELGVRAEPLVACGPRPFFLTVNETAGPADRHIDVSLWYAFAGFDGMAIDVDEREARSARWWSMDELCRSEGRRFDPHLPRAVAKLREAISSAR